VPDTLANAALVYMPDNYNTSQPRLMGRHSATEGFLKAFVRHGRVDRFYCYTSARENFEAFTKQVSTYANGPRPTEWIAFTKAADLARAGCVYRPGPNIGYFAWERRHFNQRAYSLCGVTHTTAEHVVMDALGDLLLAPVQPWDAVVCTSRAVKGMVEHQLAHWGEYLGERTGGAVRVSVQLPIIPLGVDCAALERTPAAEQARRTSRQRLGIGPDDIVVLFVGRLNLIEKANPLPMYLGLEEAARRTGKRFHLIQAGWFASEPFEKAFKQGGSTLAPSVNHIYLDGRKEDVRANIWFTADIFTSLSDNIQETFGLTPIEAMAAGLPVVVSDWDGYRDTVRDGVDGMCVPTLMPPPGPGEELALRYAMLADGYGRYCGVTSQCISVDPAACAAAYTRLAQDAALRRAMGEAGRRRARELYDWKVVIAAYQELWGELAERRRGEREVAPRRPGQPANPMRDDPFALFAGYPTALIEADAQLTLTPGAGITRLELFRSLGISNYGGYLLAPKEDVDRLVERLARQGPCTVAEALASVPAERQAALHRSLGWLAKTGLVQIQVHGQEPDRKKARSASEG
jgi:glycosyltransferase involved in cell wall biosynthesis